MTVLVWQRRGMLFRSHDCAAVRSHAQAPTVLVLRPDLWRIYYAGRDDGNKSSIFAVDVDPIADMRLVTIHEEPVFSRGERGAFDHFGLGPSCAFVRADGRVALYYTGITPRRDVPTEFAIGLATSDDGLRFERASAGPVLGRGPFDPYFVSTPFVRPSGAGYEMWYISGTGWVDAGDRVEPVYDFRKTYSRDGISWDPATTLAIRARDLGGVAVARPWIAFDGVQERLWFCMRGEEFRESGTGAYRLWSAPLDARTIVDMRAAREAVYENPARPEEWDGAMQAYPCIVRRGEDLIGFYNGNEFGRDGFGWAVARVTA